MRSVICALALLAVAVGAAQAQTYKIGQIVIADPWLRATPGRARNGAGYVSLDNHGAPDRLIGVASDVAERTELHTHMADGGIMRMRKVDAIDLPTGASAVLKPHGDHIMLMNLKQPLKEGETVRLTLTFENAGEITVDARVLPIGSMGANAGAEGHDMKGHGGKTMKTK